MESLACSQPTDHVCLSFMWIFVETHTGKPRNDPQRWGGINDKTGKVIYSLNCLLRTRAWVFYLLRTVSTPDGLSCYQQVKVMVVSKAERADENLCPVFLGSYFRQRTSSEKGQSKGLGRRLLQDKSSRKKSSRRVWDTLLCWQFTQGQGYTWVNVGERRNPGMT